MRWNEMIHFDRIEKDRMYLGFTQVELDFILATLEKHLPNDEMTKRIDALAMVFHKQQVETKKK